MGQTEETRIEELIRAEKARYAREWRTKNPDKARASNQRYWRKMVERKQKEAGENA